MGFDEAGLLKILASLPQPTGWLIAYSGGLDSRVLLEALARLQPRLGQPVRAVHVHHGLLPHADAWSEHCRETCDALGLPLETVRLDLQVPPGESLEAVAREARYQALAERLGQGEMLLTAQHRDDQAETLLLQALRGAGIEGLAGMPRCRPWHNGWQARPLLDYPRADLHRWAQEQGLAWVEDPSNEDRRFDRNYLRHAVMPVLRARWPGAARTLARSAGHLADSLTVLREVAQTDLAACRDGSELRLDCVAALSGVRRAMLLRTWIRDSGHPVPDQRRLQTIIGQVLSAAEDRSPCVSWDGVSLRRYRNHLYLTPDPLPPVPSAEIPWQEPVTLPLPPGCGELRLEAAELGIPRHAWTGGRVQVRWGENPVRCRLQGRAGARGLKKLCQEWGAPPWQRPYLPLIFVDDQLASIAGLGLCEGPVATAGDNLRPIWRPG